MSDFLLIDLLIPLSDLSSVHSYIECAAKIETDFESVVVTGPNSQHNGPIGSF